MSDPDSRIAIETTLACLPDLERWIAQLSGQFALAPLLRNRIEVCLTELITNLISYGYPDGRSGTARLAFWQRPDRYTVCIQDDGRPFDPTAYKLPATPGSLDEASASGRGIPLVRRFADALEYRRHDGSNQLMLVFKAENLPASCLR